LSGQCFKYYLIFMKQKTKKTIELVNFLHHLINKKKLLKPNQSMVLAISGGQDSISLFFIFLQLKNQWNWNLSIIYCNHLWQKDSFYTMSHLFKLAYLLNIPIYLAVTLQKIFTEQKARNWRSLTFQRMTGFYFFSIIVLGHSKSDRVETGLFNLFRGSSTKGVSSLNWTKIVVKECFFKLSKTQLNQISNKNEQTNPDKPETKTLFQVCLRFVCSFLFELFLFSLSENIKNFNKICYKITKNTSVETQLLKPIISQIDLGKSRKDVFFKRKSSKLINKNSITNVIKKFLTYKVGVHFKGNFSTRTTLNIAESDVHNSLFEKKMSQSFEKKKKIILKEKQKNFLSTQHHIFAINLMNTFVYTNTIRKEEKQKNNVKIETFLTKIRPKQKLNKNKNKNTIFVSSQTNLKQTLNKPVTLTKNDDKKSEAFFVDHFLSVFQVCQGLLSFGRICKPFFFFRRDYGAGAPKKFLSRFYKHEYTLVRPFLSISRFDLKKICNSWKVPLFPDQSNQKLKYQRNRIRKQILPTLRFFFNPQIDTTIFQFIEIINSEQEYMDFITARIVKEIQYKKETIVELETSFLAVLPIALRRKIMKQFLEKIMKKSLKFFDIEKLLEQVSTSKGVIRQEDALSTKKEQKKINKKKIKLLTFDKTQFQNSLQIYKTSAFMSNLQKKRNPKTKSVLQKDVLVDLINQKKAKCQISKLIFFPKTGCVFLQSQRIFFIKKEY
jgi:tRNA(Ile)-lysidine synthetase-like protein